MSGLEKFEATESWRMNLKNFLLIQRKPRTVKKTQVTGEPQRCSLDIAEDLQKLIRERKEQIELEKKEKLKLGESEETECRTNNMDHLNAQFEDTCYGIAQDLPMIENISDESFEALEKMCNKTASDPNSTLFQYLYSDRQEEVLADAKKRSVGEEIEHLKEADQLVAKLTDCTLLDDVEAPSRIWENTIIAENVLGKTSPIKMVGLLRPSTIIEETGDESVNSDISSQMSYQTASKGRNSDVSSTYDTAFDSTVTSTRTNEVAAKLDKEEINVDNILEMAIERSQKLAIVSASESSEIQSTEEYPKDRLTFEKSIPPFHIPPHCNMVSTTNPGVVVIEDDENVQQKGMEQDVVEVADEDEDDDEESVIDIVSDDEVDENILEGHNYHYTEDKTKAKHLNNDSYEIGNASFEENKENCTQDSMNRDRSMKFNDTMEEVEYMLKKGMEYMAAQEMHSLQTPAKLEDKDPQMAPIQKVPLVVNQEKTNYPVKQQIKASTQLRTCRTQPNTPISSARKPGHTVTSLKKVKDPKLGTLGKSSSRNQLHQIPMKPFPKFDLFDGNTTRNMAKHPRQRELASKKPFSHVVSPVGAYMKNTASTPLMSKGTMRNSNTSVMNSLAFRELEYESRLYEPRFDTYSPSSGCSSGLSALPGIKGIPQTLPKKAYISSELKHIVDERIPITIPGGKKIHKYLENAMMPAVLRHDGKMKFPGAPNVPNSSHHKFKHPADMKGSSHCVSSPHENNGLPSTTSSRRNDASLADLSVMSGDVSMYTIMDAQKF